VRLCIYELIKQFALQLEIWNIQKLERNDNKIAYELGGMAVCTSRGVFETWFSDFRPVTNMLVAKDTIIT
jgi:hypothetical protein